MRLAAWNIRAGGGTRISGIHAQIVRWKPDVVGLCEFRATPPSLRLAQGLAAEGLPYQATTAEPASPARNALLIASKWPITRIDHRNAPVEPGRWLAVRIEAPTPFVVGLMHVPNQVTGRKQPFLQSVLTTARRWRRGPAILMGDTNCGWPGIDEQRPVFNVETERWLNSMVESGWPDAFRFLKPAESNYTWYSPNGGNGFRLDQAFINRGMVHRLRGATYEWGQSGDRPARRDTLSDHAALLLDFDPA